MDDESVRRHRDAVGGAGAALIRCWICCLMLCVVAASSRAAPPPRVLTLAANSWEPYTGATMPQQGIASEIVVTALSRAGYASKIRFMPWSRALNETYGGQVDGVVTIWSTQQRRARLLLSDSYLSNAMHLMFLRPEVGKLLSAGTLDGLRVGAGRNYEYSDSFLASYKLLLEPVDRLPQNLGKLRIGRIDMMLEDKHAVDYLLRHTPEFADFPALRYSAAPVLQLPLHFAMNRNHPDAEVIVAAVNAQFKAMRKDGTLAAILRKLDAQQPDGRR